jgi:hypothetical protein
MAASSASIGYGATVTFGGTAIEEVIDVVPPQPTLDAVEATHLGSDNTHKEYIAGLCSGGDIKVKCNYRPKATGQLLFTNNLQSRTAASLVVTLPATLGTWTATCLCTSWVPDSITPDGRMTATATFKVTGKPVLS